MDDLDLYSSEDDIPEASNPATTDKTSHVAFEDFLLKPELLRAIGDCGYEHPSPVQSECLPPSLMGIDVLCQAQSGMGKTAVFVLGTLQLLYKEDDVACLVLCHTRELAYQIQLVFDLLKKYLPWIRAQVVFGGVPVALDRNALKSKKPQIVIGTPGRVLHLVEEKSLKLDGLKHFVIDECDQVLQTLSMRRDVQKIFAQTPHTKQVMMFSATLSEEMRAVCKRFMVSPREIYINDGEKLTLRGLQQYFVKLSEKEKNRKLVDLLDALEFNQVVIFVKSTARCEALCKLLNQHGFPSIYTHGHLEQNNRIEKYQQFKEFSKRILVATNLLGRGVDFERVNVVINYDMPEDEDVYHHRVGRAGRFGTKGLAISFVAADAGGGERQHGGAGGASGAGGAGGAGGAFDEEEVLKRVRSKFVVPLPELPDVIEPSTYMSS